MLLILHAFTCLCWAGTFGTHARASVGQAHRHLQHTCTPLSGRHTGTFGTHARASIGQALRHLRHACTPLSGRHNDTFGTHARASVVQAHRHLRHACTHLSGRYLRGTLFNMALWHVYHYPAYTLKGRLTLRSILFSMA